MFSFTNISGLISVLRIFGVYFILIFFYILCFFFLSKETLFFLSVLYYIHELTIQTKT